MLLAINTIINIPQLSINVNRLMNNNYSEIQETLYVARKAPEFICDVKLSLQK